MRSFVVRWVVAAAAVAVALAVVGTSARGGSEQPASRTVARVDECADRDALPAQIPPPSHGGDVLFDIDFDQIQESRTYDAADLAAEWRSPPWSNGVDEGRVSVETTDAGARLRVRYPAGAAGSGDSGAQWQTGVRPVDAVHLGYSVRFDPDFDFVRGGKLPGVAGGTANTGGSRPDGTDGWSARMMWRENGCAVQYVYHPDQPGSFGEDFRWSVRFRPGVWHRIEHVVVMNAPGERDGVILGWIDGRLVLERRDLRFRDTAGLAIDLVYFSTFFGGGDRTWAPDSDQFVEFDDLVATAIDAESVDRG